MFPAFSGALTLETVLMHLFGKLQEVVKKMVSIDGADDEGGVGIRFSVRSMACGYTADAKHYSPDFFSMLTGFPRRRRVFSVHQRHLSGFPDTSVE